MNPHRGILISRVPVDGIGGLIFVVGMSVLLIVAVPALRPLVVFSIVGGILCAPLMNWLHSH